MTVISLHGLHTHHLGFNISSTMATGPNAEAALLYSAAGPPSQS